MPLHSENGTSDDAKPEPSYAPAPLHSRAFLAVMVFVSCVIVAIKVESVMRVTGLQIWTAYGVAVATFILGRFALSPFYRPSHQPMADDDLPCITIVVPAKNEGEPIRRTLATCLDADYPRGKLQVIAVNDGSTDDTLSHMQAVAAAADGRLQLISFERNRGKRHAMAAGARAATGEILVFIDSDSRIHRDSLRALAPYFVDSTVGAVCGHTDVENSTKNLLTRMQAVHYFVAFRAYKAAEALFSSVTCCSGCFSGYRRSAVMSVLERFESQQFFGMPSTFGDDRSLTNFLLRDWKVLYAPNATASTTVPETTRHFVRQQLRWKKSWLRENTRAAAFMWRKPLPMALLFYLGIVLPVLAPHMLIRALVIGPVIGGVKPGWYLGGIVLVLLLQGVYFRAFRKDRIWLSGALASLGYVFLAVWQLPYAMATIRDGRWGTR